jgi:NTP pyrophosphatase (non-canonical NTP hydrolase)
LSFAGASALPVVRSNKATAIYSGDAMSELVKLRNNLRAFAADRDWDKFHSPKNLAAALAVEAAELLEPFQWLTEEESAHLSEKQLSAVRDEIADVLNYLIRLADKLDIDLIDAANDKIRKNAEKYPADKFRGSASKYSDR